MTSDFNFPTQEHKDTAHCIQNFFQMKEITEAVLLTCSCARGKATRDSCLDIAVLIAPYNTQQKKKLVEEWENYLEQEPFFKKLQAAGKYSHVDLDFFDGDFNPEGHGWTTGADSYELEIGNYLVYSKPLWVKSDYLDKLKTKYLPYYSEKQRKERLDRILNYLFNNLEHIPLYIERKLYFQSFDRLYKAFGEFLQALFISKKMYPIAYDKWIKEQVVEILHLPDLYPELTALFEIDEFESNAILKKSQKLMELVHTYIEV